MQWKADATSGLTLHHLHETPDVGSHRKVVQAFMSWHLFHLAGMSDVTLLGDGKVQSSTPLLGWVADTGQSLCELKVRKGVLCCSAMSLGSGAASAGSLTWLSAGSLGRPASWVSMSAEACRPEARRWSSTSMSSSAGG